MNTHTIHCPQGSQRCPSPWACGEGCNFNNAELPKLSAQERAAAKFWEELPVKFTGPEPEVSQDYPFAWLDYLLNQWDRCNWWQKVLVVCAAVILCGLVGGMAASHLVGPK